MSEPTSKKPRTFDLEEKTAEKRAKPTKVPRPKAIDIDDVKIDDNAFDLPDQEGLPEPLSPSGQKRSYGLSWAKLFFGSLTLIASLAIGLAIDHLVQSLFARHEWLGWLGLMLTVLVVIAACALALREFLALRRLSHITKTRKKAQEVFESHDPKAAEDLERQVIGIYSNRSDMTAAKAKLSQHSQDIIDTKGRITLIERELLSPLDDKANTLVLNAAKRVAIVTAVSPRALIDIAYVLIENLRLIRAIAELYGGRPGTLGSWRLTRRVLTHLAVTGAISIGDGLIQQVVGHGLASKISARFGEGVVNGLLTARIGLAAQDICRPVPFLITKRKPLITFMNALISLNGDKKKNDQTTSP